MSAIFVCLIASLWRHSPKDYTHGRLQILICFADRPQRQKGKKLVASANSTTAQTLRIRTFLARNCDIILLLCNKPYVVNQSFSQVAPAIFAGFCDTLTQTRGSLFLKSVESVPFVIRCKSLCLCCYGCASLRLRHG